MPAINHNNNNVVRDENQINQRINRCTSLRFLSLLPFAFFAIYSLVQAGRRQFTSENSVIESHEEIFQMINRTCTTIPFNAPNKPPGMVVDRMYNWNASAFPDVIDLHPDLNAARNNLLEIEIPLAMKNMMMPNKLAASIIPELQRRFYEYSTTLGILREIYALHTMALKVGMGNCGEHAAYTAFEIIKLSLRLKQNIKVARIEGTDAKYKTTHAFVMVDSDLTYAILERQESIKNYVNSLKSSHAYPTGLICDTWNEGLFTTIDASNNPLYSLKNKQALTVAVYHLDFDYSGLPTVAVNYLRDGLAQMGLESLHGKPKIRFFDKWHKTTERKAKLIEENSKRAMLSK